MLFFGFASLFAVGFAAGFLFAKKKFDIKPDKVNVPPGGGGGGGQHEQ